MTPHFTGELILKAIPPNLWETYAPFGYVTLVTGKPQTLVIPVGFRNDLASIPRMLRGLVPQVGRHRSAAVIHDWLYQNQHIHNYSRAQCDAIFSEAMKASGVPWHRRAMMYRGVRMGGWVAYNKYTKEI